MGMMITPNDPGEFWRLPRVRQEAAVSKHAIYKLVRTGRFPRPRKVGAASVWLAQEVIAWKAAIAAGREWCS